MHYERWRSHGDPEYVTPRKRAAWRDPVTDDVPSKKCSTCKRQLALDAFSKSSGRHDGLANRCKDCCRAAYNERYKNDPSFRDQRARYSSQYYTTNADRRRRDRRRNLNKYGLTFEEFEVMAAAQNGLCAICGQHPTASNPASRKKRLAVDHDHESGRVRGLLCDPCNTGLGMFRDNAATLRAAANYLDQHRP